MKTRQITLLGAMVIVTMLITLSAQAAGNVTIDKDPDGQYQVKIGDRLFTVLHTQGFNKPILYPILGPGGVRMTRDYPMKEGTPDEAKDHPHQQSLWFTHGDVNGVSFWHLGKDAGRIVTTKVTDVVNDGSRAWVALLDNWVDATGKLICTDEQKITFHNLQAQGSADLTAIDYQITLHASEGDVVFGDTKEGTMGIRTNPALRIDHGATAVNSEGVTGKSIWGKRANWVDYTTRIDNQKVGVAIFDHPANPRHPTWWHAREYGLVAANPFGISDFEKKPKGTGDFKIAKGDQVTFRYRFLFHSGDATEAGIAKAFQTYAANSVD